jgi:predicted nucleic acid-binding protein
MTLIDTNSLVILLIGIIDPKLISLHKRTSIYEEEDHTNLLKIIKSLDRLIVLPNIWTEVDNLLNNFSGNYRWKYVQAFRKLIQLTSEKYIPSSIGTENAHFLSIGLTDALILELGKECDFLITSDSKLSDFVKAEGIAVYDLVKIRNEKFED